MEGHLVVNATITGMELGGSLLGLQPQLIVRNLLGEDYLQMGRQSGSGARPAGMLQPEIQNPSGFIPPYHPQAETAAETCTMCRSDVIRQTL